METPGSRQLRQGKPCRYRLQYIIKADGGPLKFFQQLIEGAFNESWPHEELKSKLATLMGLLKTLTTVPEATMVKAKEDLTKLKEIRQGLSLANDQVALMSRVTIGDTPLVDKLEEWEGVMRTIDYQLTTLLAAVTRSEDLADESSQVRTLVQELLQFVE